MEMHQFSIDLRAGRGGVTNDQVYRNTVQPLVATLFRGGKATCFAYGQVRPACRGTGCLYTGTGWPRICSPGQTRPSHSKPASSSNHTMVLTCCRHTLHTDAQRPAHSQAGNLQGPRSAVHGPRQHPAISRHAFWQWTWQMQVIVPAGQHSRTHLTLPSPCSAGAYLDCCQRLIAAAAAAAAGTKRPYAAVLRDALRLWCCAQTGSGEDLHNAAPADTRSSRHADAAGERALCGRVPVGLLL